MNSLVEKVKVESARIFSVSVYAVSIISDAVSRPGFPVNIKDDFFLMLPPTYNQ
jgi:hypothetical protein